MSTRRRRDLDQGRASGLPKSPLGKIDVAIAPSDSKRVYALIQTADQGSLWRSDDGGATWKVVSWDRALIGRAGYYIRLGVSPANADEVLVANSSSHRSTDGGVTFQPWGGCGDCHDIWFDPTNADRFAMTDDGGMQITTNHGQSDVHAIRLPIGQMYHVAVDNQVPYYIYSNMQDDGTMRGPSTSPEAVAEQRRARRRTGGGRRRWRRAVEAAAAPAVPVGSRARRLRVRLHASRSDRPRHRLGVAATATS